MGLNRRHFALCAGLLLFLATNYIVAIHRTTLTNDELAHIPAGYYYLVGHHFELNNEHPPLVKLWAAIPTLAIVTGRNEHFRTDAGTDSVNQRWDFFIPFWIHNADHFRLLNVWPRLMMVPIALLLGVSIFLIANKVFGPRAAVFALAFYCFEPTVLAHGRIVHTDVPASLAYLLFFFALYYYMSDPGLKGALFLGLVAGIALVTKFSMVVVLPVILVAFVYLLSAAPRLGRDRKRVCLHTGITVIASLLVINTAYLFKHPELQPVDVQSLAMLWPARFETVLAIIRLLSYIFPTYFLYGLSEVWRHNLSGHPASLLQLYSTSGWWYYYPLSFALKTTVPFVVVSVTAILWHTLQFHKRKARLHLLTTIPILIYLAAAVSSHVNIGVRHFLPVFPFLFILAGGLFQQMLTSRRRISAIAFITIVLVWAAIEAARTFPHYTSYMNGLARGPNWHYLSDSNVEWGDDVGSLAEYLHQHEVTKIKAALLGGSLTLPLHGVAYEDVMAAPPSPHEYIALGASFLNGSTVSYGPKVDGEYARVNYFAYFRALKPEAVFGNSIYLYRIPADSQ